MKKRTHWFVAAGLALCGLLLAALTLGRSREQPGQWGPARGAGDSRLEGRTGPGKARVLRRKRMKYAF